MSVLEDIAYFQRKSSEELFDVKQALFRLEKPDPVPEPIPEIYINSSEVQRILEVSVTSVASWAKEGLLNIRKNDKCPTNKFLASEVLWLQKQKYTFLSPGQVKKLIEKRVSELGS